MKYKVGDVVRLRKDIKVGEKYGSQTFVSLMSELKNIDLIIEYVYKDHYVTCGWGITDEMIDGLVNKKDDAVSNPAHYNQGKIEVLDFIIDQQLDFTLGNVVKYVCRAKHKGKELEDLKKAAVYLDRQIKLLESKHE